MTQNATISDSKTTEAVVVTESDPTQTTQKRLGHDSKTTEQGQKVSKPMETTERGQLILGNLSDQMSFADKLIKNKMIGSSFKTAQQVVIGIQFAKSLDMDVVPALKMMFVLNGVPSLYGDGPLAMCQRTGLVVGFEEFWVDKDGKQICVKNKNLSVEVFASICRVKRAGDSRWQEDFFSLDDLDRAGINMSQYGEKDVWKKFKRIMMRYKARSMALKSKFADKLNGIGILEYDNHATIEIPETLAPEHIKKVEQINASAELLT